MFLRSLLTLLGIWFAVTGFAGDVVVVCPSQLQAGIEPWIRYRRSQGTSIHLIASKPQAADIVADIRRLIQPGTIKPQAIVLMGDCVLRGPGWPVDPARYVPTFHVPSPVAASLGSLPTLATDSLYGDLDGDQSCDVPVGRIPIDRPEQMVGLVQRIEQYESSRDFGSWRHTMDLVAGVGGFGIIVDSLIESVARNLLTSNLPTHMQTQVCYASPTSMYFPGYDSFCDGVRENFNQGRLFWVYAGHGHVNSLDHVPPQASGQPILDNQSIGRLNCPAERAPIALLLACYTGAFDASEDCLAERMLLQPGGPIAVIAGSRMTLPYGNAKMAGSMIRAWFDSQPETLGQMWLQTLALTNAQEVTDPNRPPAMIDALATLASPTADRLPEERREHTRLYNLLGDPLLRLVHLQPMSIQCPRLATPGEQIIVRGQAPQAGRLVIELHRRGEAKSETLQETDLVLRQRKASRSLLDRQALDVGQGAFDVSVQIPQGDNPSLTVVARLESAQHGWIGAANLLLEPSAAAQ